jgi:osmotically-inducible protein OsmY
MIVRSSPFLWSILCFSVVLTRCTPVAVVGGGVAAGMALREKSAGDSLTDSMISVRVMKAIYKIGPEIHARVGVNVQEHEVLLTGNVPSEKIRRAVETAVWSVQNVKRVYNHLEISDTVPIQSYHKDAWITSNLKAKLFTNAQVTSINYSIKTFNSVVYICGIAQNREELQRILDIASHIKGVERVVSYVRLKNPETSQE